MKGESLYAIPLPVEKCIITFSLYTPALDGSASYLAFFAVFLWCVSSSWSFWVLRASTALSANLGSWRGSSSGPPGHSSVCKRQVLPPFVANSQYWAQCTNYPQLDYTWILPNTSGSTAACLALASKHAS